MYIIRYQIGVVTNDIPKLGTSEKRLIQKAIDNKLIEHPEVYGVSLRRALKAYRKLRVGDYRVIFRMTQKEVLIFVIAHRSVAYKIAEKRL